MGLIYYFISLQSLVCQFISSQISMVLLRNAIKRPIFCYQLLLNQVSALQYKYFKLNRHYCYQQYNPLSADIHRARQPSVYKMIQQDTPFKYGLKNASAFLHKLRRQKQSIHNFSHDTVNQKQRTFQQEYIPSSKGSPQHEQSTQFGYKNKKQWMETIEHRHQFKNNITTKDNHHSKEAKPKHEGQHKYNQSNAHSHSKSHASQPISLASLVIQQHLKKSLETYTQDLNQMYQNRDNLFQAIQQISIKIKSLTDLQNKNQLYELQNFKSRKQLSFLMKDYHELKVTLEKKKLKIQESFLRKKQKIKVLLELFQMENQYVVEAESWNFYYKDLIQNKNLNTENPSDKKVIQLIFPKLESQGQKEKDKKKQKAKVIDKSGLLGDLKSFAKNFKMPANQNANQV